MHFFLESFITEIVSWSKRGLWNTADAAPPAPVHSVRYRVIELVTWKGRLDRESNGKRSHPDSGVCFIMPRCRITLAPTKLICIRDSF